MAGRISSFAFVTAATTKVPYFAPLAASFFAFHRSTYSMAIRVVEFSNGGYKIRKIFALESTYPKEMIEF